MPSGTPVVVGDVGSSYIFPSTPPVTSSFPMVSGVPNVLIHSKPVLTLAVAQTAGGPIASATLFSTKTLVAGSPVILGGALTNLATGWLGGTIQASGAAGVLVG